MTKKNKLRIVVGAPFQFLVALRCFKSSIRGFLHRDQSVRGEPAAISGGSECFLCQAPAVGRVEEGEREWRQWMRRPELGGVAAEDAGDAAEAEPADIVAQQRTRLDAVVYEQGEGGTARDRLDTERAGAGKQIKHARVRHWVAVGVRQDVEQRFTQPVGGRPQSGRAWPGDGART